MKEAKFVLSDSSKDRLKALRFVFLENDAMRSWERPRRGRELPMKITSAARMCSVLSEWALNMEDLPWEKR